MRGDPVFDSARARNPQTQMTVTTQKEVTLQDEIGIAHCGLAIALFHAKDQTHWARDSEPSR
jgi:hypothetical protein